MMNYILVKGGAIESNVHRVQCCLSLYSGERQGMLRA